MIRIFAFAFVWCAVVWPQFYLVESTEEDGVVVETYVEEQNLVTTSVIKDAAHENDLIVDMETADKKSRVSDALYQLAERRLQFTVEAKPGRMVSGTQLVRHLFAFIQFLTGQRVHEMGANWSYGTNLAFVHQHMKYQMHLYEEDRAAFMDVLVQTAKKTWTGDLMARNGLTEAVIDEVSVEKQAITNMSVRFFCP